MYKLEYYVPKEMSETVKNAIFDAGGGRVGNYENCCFVTQGVGQFKPIGEARPTIGEIGTLEYVEEEKVELIVQEQNIKAVIKAMKSSHPYEVVAHQIFKCLEF